MVDEVINGALTENEKSEKRGQYATSKNNRIDASMRKAAELLVMRDINGMTNDQIAEECGVNRSTLYRWKQKPEFNDYLNELTEEFQRSFLSDAYSELRKIMLYGKSHEKLKAIELMLKNQGRLKDVKETTAKVETELNVGALFKELGI